MIRPVHAVPIITALMIALSGCGGDDSTGPAGANCAGGQGSVVEFCRQVDHYEAGFGVPGLDVITATCLVGPNGATVSNQMNGTYYCGGTYKLTSFPTATIELNWGGSTSYSDYAEHQITSPGEGSFSVRVNKISGGAGNLFLTMSSGSSWMFDVVLVNTNCPAGSAAPTRQLLQVPRTSHHIGSLLTKTVPWVYGSSDNRR